MIEPCGWTGSGWNNYSAPDSPSRFCRANRWQHACCPSSFYAGHCRACRPARLHLRLFAQSEHGVALRAPPLQQCLEAAQTGKHPAADALGA